MGDDDAASDDGDAGDVLDSWELGDLADMLTIDGRSHLPAYVVQTTAGLDSVVIS